MLNGTLTPSIALDKPGSVHCGSQEPVTGQVCLRYQPGWDMPTDAELFGPLRVTIMFHGRAKTKIQKDKEHHRGRVPLFSMSCPVYDGPVKIAAGATHAMPFSICFPEAMQARGFPGFESQDIRFDASPGQLLPPTMRMKYFGFTQNFECFVEYWLETRVAMPGLNININVSGPGDGQGPRVQYERPRLPLPVEPKPFQFRGTLRIQNKYLLPEADRPQGFREKTKAALSSSYYPVAAFGWNCTAPTQVCRGQPIQLTVRAWPRTEACTCPALPEVKLLRCAIKIVAYTHVRSEINFVRCHSGDGKEDIVWWESGTPADATPFREADGWAKTVNTMALRGVPSSFRSVCIAQFYRMQASVTFSLAGETREFKSEIPLAVYPPYEVQAPEPVPKELSPPAYEDAANPPKYTAAPA